MKWFYAYSETSNLQSCPGQSFCTLCSCNKDLTKIWSLHLLFLKQLEKEKGENTNQIVKHE